MAKKDRDMGTPSFKEKLGESLDIPADLLCGGTTLEMRGRGDICVGGCRKIAIFTEETIRLEMSDFDIILKGERLSCFTFCEGRTVIGGRIKSIEIEDRR